MPPSLDPEIRNIITWLPSEDGGSYRELPIGPMRWVNHVDGRRIAIGVGKVKGETRRKEIFAVDK